MKQNYLFHYIISGKGIFFDTEKQEQCTLSNGQGFLIPPHHMCSYEADQTDPWHYIWIEFNGLKTEHFLKQAGLTSKQLVYKSSKKSENSHLYQEMNHILMSASKNSASIIGHLYLFIDYLISESEQHISRQHDDIKELYIREAINYIQNNYSKNISINDIADHCNLNRSYFSRLFKENLTITPQQFLSQYRLSRSCELLQNNSLSLQEIAEHIGYSNQFNFSAAFKKQYHESPKKWQKRHTKVF